MQNIKEEYDIINSNQNVIFQGIFGCQNALQLESSIGFAHYLNYLGINHNNYLLFLKLIQTNNKWIVDSLVGKSNPRLLFSTISPDQHLIKKAFRFLTLWHPKQIYSKILLSLLGIIESGYHNPDEGYKIYPLKIADLNNLGKYLNILKDQSFYENAVILNILDQFTQIGNYRWNLEKSILSKQAFKIRNAYFDNTKQLADAIPHVLLIQLNREEIIPSEAYLGFLKNREKGQKHLVGDSYEQ